MQRKKEENQEKQEKKDRKRMFMEKVPADVESTISLLVSYRNF